MKILFWVPYPTEGASNRYRVEQYLPYLERESMSYRLHPFWTSAGYKILYQRGNILKKIYYFIRGTFSRLLDLLSVWRCDIVFIHRESYPMGPAFFESILHIMGKPLIFDFDDAVFLPANSHQNSFVKTLKRPGKIKYIIKISSYTIAGNNYLADFSRDFSDKIKVIPTSIDTDKFFAETTTTGHKKEIVIGWIGSGTTIEFVRIISGVITRLSKKYSNVVFKIVGGSLKIEGHDNLVSKPWSLEGEIEDLKSFDIGIMPMEDNAWTRGKCGFKAILYMSMGIPSVCSPVGVNKEIVTDGVNGFLAADEDEWVEKISRLIDDKELRVKMGLSGRKTVEEKYSVKANAPIFLNIIKQVYVRKAGR